MTVKNFIDEYIKNNDTSVVKKHIICTYLPFVKKCNLCERIIKATYYIKNNDGTHRLHIDSLSKHMLFNLVIVDTYTDIDVNFDNAANEYDLLAEHGLFGEITHCIGNAELTELMNLLEMKKYDVMKNEYEPYAFISNQVERFGSLFGISLSPAIERLVNIIEHLDAEKVAQIVDVTSKLDNSNIVKLFK